MRIKINETDIKKVIKDWLNIKGIFNFHLLAGLGAYKGCPDRIAIYKGKIICIEVKTITGMQSIHQKLFQKNVEKAGGIYVLARCVEDVEEIITTI